MKKFAWKKWPKMFLEALFFAFEKKFSEFLYKILVIAVYMRSLAYNSLNIFLQIIIQNYDV